MATRSTISIIKKNNTIQSIYCHFDGDTVGNILNEYYNDYEKVIELINLGSLSYLTPIIKPEIGVKHSFSNPAEGVTVAYCRDRFEDLRIDKFTNLKFFYLEGDFQECNYIFEDGKWFSFKNKDKLLKVSSILASDLIIESTTKGFKSIEVTFDSAYDELIHRHYNEKLKNSLKIEKVSVFNFIEDINDLISICFLLKTMKDVKIVKFI